MAIDWSDIYSRKVRSDHRRCPQPPACQLKYSIKQPEPSSASQSGLNEVVSVHSTPSLPPRFWMLVSEPLRGLLLAVFLLASCSNIAFYDQAAYANAVDTKVQTLALMNLAVNPYSSQSAEIAGVNLQMQKAYEYDRGRPMNQTTLQMWDVLLKTDPEHPDEGLWPRFLERWRKSGTLSPVFISDKKEHLATAFDAIIALESGKNRS
jgi:hypothetical protein